MATIDLTLPIDASTAERAVRLAQARGVSLEEYLSRLIELAANPPSEAELGPVSRRLAGMAPPLSDSEVQEVLDEHREDKHRQP